MEAGPLVVLSVAMTRRLETVLLFSALLGVGCVLALTSFAAGISTVLR
jgi:hypothetical protein